MTAINPFDTTIMNFVQENLHNTFTDAIFPIITYLGEIGCIWILSSIVLLFFKKYRTYGMLALISLLLTFFVGDVVIKNIVCRSRPCYQFPNIAVLIAKPNGFSFPSGHSGSSFTAATVFFFASKKLGICALILASLIAFSRVFLFVHYPTDVIVGTMLGISLGIVTVMLYRKIHDMKKALAK